MKRCSICTIEKVEEDFAFQNKKEKKLMSACKECNNKRQRDKRLKNPKETRANDKKQYQKHREKRIQAAKEYRRKHPEKTKNTNLKVKYGITLDDYNRMFKIQDGKCAICGIHQNEINKSLCVDHCHNSKKVRGLLCDTCNKLLGFYERLSKKCEIYLMNNN